MGRKRKMTSMPNAIRQLHNLCESHIYQYRVVADSMVLVTGAAATIAATIGPFRSVGAFYIY